MYFGVKVQGRQSVGEKSFSIPYPDPLSLDVRSTQKQHAALSKKHSLRYQVGVLGWLSKWLAKKMLYTVFEARCCD